MTHQFNLNNKTILDPETDTGTIESPVFITFGPPLDMSDNEYTLDVRIVLVDGRVVEQAFDIGDQVEPFIEQVKQNLAGTRPIAYHLTIPLELELELPEAEPIEGSIGIGDWGDDEVIRVPIKPKAIQ